MKIFIAGGTSGIGLAVAKRYLNNGHNVAICGRNQDRIDKIEKSDNLKIYKLDIYDNEKFIEAVKDFSHGELDIMLVAAGSYGNSRTKKLSLMEATNMLKTNIVSTVNAFEIARKLMIPRGKGHIVAISSVAALLDYPGCSVYSKTKRIVINLCEAYRAALSDSGIKVTAIIPGYIDTLKLREISGDVSNKPFIMSEENAAKIIIDSIEKNVDRVIFPKKMKVLISILSLVPKKILSLILLRKKNG